MRKSHNLITLYLRIQVADDSGDLLELGAHVGVDVDVAADAGDGRGAQGAQVLIVEGVPAELEGPVRLVGDDRDALVGPERGPGDGFHVVQEWLQVHLKDEKISYFGAFWFYKEQVFINC